MWRIVALCWVFTAPALAGALVVAVLATPQLAAEAGLWIPIAALLGALYGVPAARCIARFVEAPAAPEAVALRWGWGLAAAPGRRSPTVGRDAHLRLVIFLIAVAMNGGLSHRAGRRRRSSADVPARATRQRGDRGWSRCRRRQKPSEGAWTGRAVAIAGARARYIWRAARCGG